MKFAPSSIRLSFGDRHTIILDPPREKFSLKIYNTIARRLGSYRFKTKMSMTCSK